MWCADAQRDVKTAFPSLLLLEEKQTDLAKWKAKKKKKVSLTIDDSVVT